MLPEKPRLRLLLVEDHALVREGLRLLVEQRDFEVVGQASSLSEALALDVEPDVVLVDVMLGDASGAEVVGRLAARFAPGRVVVLSGLDDPETVRAAFAAGARAYLVKGTTAAELADAIQRVARGEEYVPPSLGAAFVRGAAASAEAPAIPLSPREIEIVRLLALGYTSAEIAKKLSVSSRTVDADRAGITRKLGLRSRAELVRYAIEKGLLRAGLRQESRPGAGDFRPR